MIGFLHPLLWLAALAAGVPIALHLIRRRDVRRIPFPAIRYLRRAERQHARRLRLRHLLLLAVRVMIILTAAAIAAGPLIGRGSAEDHEPTAVAILIDNSQSSSALRDNRRWIDHYAERARTVLDLATRDDRISLFTAGRTGEDVAAGDVGAARRYVDRLEPIPDAAALGSALRSAERWLRSLDDRYAREVHLLSDLQRISLDEARATPPSEPSASNATTVVAFAPLASDVGNGAVGEVQPEALPLAAGEETRLSVPLHWFGPDAPADPVVVRLVHAGNVIAAAEAEFGSATILRLPAQEEGWVQGHVEIDRHGWIADDRRHFTWVVRPPPRVAVMGDAGEFLGSALNALERGGRIRRVESADADVWLSLGGDGLEGATGGGYAAIVVPPDSTLDLPRLNLQLARAGVPWRYEAITDVRGSVRLEEATALPGLENLVIRRLYRLDPIASAPTDTVLLRTTEGEPWLVRGTTSEGSAYLLLASPLTPEASALPVSAGMVPFVDAAVGDWVRRRAATRTVLEGVVPVRLPGRVQTVEHPDGSRAAAEGGAWLLPKVAGNYRALGDTGVITAFSVNAPLREADPERATREELQELLPQAKWVWVEDLSTAEWRQQVFRSRRGNLAWRPLVALLLVLAIVEAALAAPGRRRASHQQGARAAAAP